jgi:hypothetical protein
VGRRSRRRSAIRAELVRPAPPRAPAPRSQVARKLGIVAAKLLHGAAQLPRERRQANRAHLHECPDERSRRRRNDVVNTVFRVFEQNDVTDRNRPGKMRDAEVVRLEIVDANGNANPARNRATSFGLSAFGKAGSLKRGGLELGLSPCGTGEPERRRTPPLLGRSALCGPVSPSHRRSLSARGSDVSRSAFTT